MCADSCYNSIPVRYVSTWKLQELLVSGYSYTGEDPTVSVSPEDHFWITLRIEIELLRRSLGLEIR